MLNNNGKSFMKITTNNINKKEQEQINNAYSNIQQNLKAKKIKLEDTKISSYFTRFGSTGLKIISISSPSKNFVKQNSGKIAGLKVKFSTDIGSRYSGKILKYTHKNIVNYKQKRKIEGTGKKLIAKMTENKVIVRKSPILQKVKRNHFKSKVSISTDKKSIALPQKVIVNDCESIQLKNLEKKVKRIKLGSKKIKKVKGEIKGKKKIKNVLRFSTSVLERKVENTLEGKSSNDLGSSVAKKTGIYSLKYGRGIIKFYHNNSSINKNKIVTKAKVSIKRMPFTEQIISCKLQELNHGTFSYLQNIENINQYKYEFKPKKAIKKENTIALPGKINKEKTIGKKRDEIKKVRNKIGKIDSSISSKKNKIKSKNKTFKNKTFIKKQSGSKINEEKPTITKSIVTIVTKAKTKIIMIILIFSLIITFVLSILVPTSGIIIIYEGYAVVVDMAEDVIEETSSIFRKITSFVEESWDTAIDTIKTSFTNTHGAGKVNLDDIISVDTFIKGMVKYEYAKIDEEKKKYEDKGYTVTLINYENMFQGSDRENTPNDGDTNINGASVSVAKMIWKMIRREGYSEQATAGILGNLINESTLISNKYNQTGKYYGLVQWSPTRTKDLKNYCMKNKKDYTSADGQIYYLLYHDMPGYYKDKLSNFKKSTNIEIATDSFRSIIEGTNSAISSRRRYAYAAYNICNGLAIENNENDKDSSANYIEMNSTSVEQYTTVYDENSFFALMKPLWLSIMYGKYEYEPTELEMSDTAEHIGELLCGFTTSVNNEEKTVTIIVAQGGATDILSEYYTNDIEELKIKKDRNDEEKIKLSKLTEDYRMALTLLDYYNCNADGGGKSSEDIDLSKLTELSSNEKINKMISLAKTKIGNKYIYGGTDIDRGIDCSAFVQWCYRQIGINLKRTSRSQCASDGVEVSINDIQPGDLCFYCNKGTNIVGHVSMYIGNGKIIHASNSAPYPKGGIKISDFSYRTPYKVKRIVKVSEKNNNKKKG